MPFLGKWTLLCVGFFRLMDSGVQAELPLKYYVEDQQQASEDLEIKITKSKIISKGKVTPAFLSKQTDGSYGLATRGYSFDLLSTPSSP